MEYFRITNDLDFPPDSCRRVIDPETGEILELPGRWYLGFGYDQEGKEYFGDEFTLGKPYDIRGPLLIERQYPGVPLDFTFAGVDMPVVSKRVGELLEGIPA